MENYEKCWCNDEDLVMPHDKKDHEINCEYDIENPTIEGLEKRISLIWDIMYPEIEGTGLSSLIEELVECEKELDTLNRLS